MPLTAAGDTGEPGLEAPDPDSAMGVSCSGSGSGSEAGDSDAAPRGTTFPDATAGFAGVVLTTTTSPLGCLDLRGGHPVVSFSSLNLHLASTPPQHVPCDCWFRR